MNNRQNIRLEIPEPCTVDFGQMKDVGNGRFCNQCNKTVQDVSQLSDSALQLFFKTPDRVCVQLHQDQLGRAIKLSGNTGIKSTATSNISVCLLNDLLPGTLLDIAPQDPIVHENRWITGFLKDEAAQIPLHDAAISIGSLGIAFTDALGWFKLFVPQGAECNTFLFSVSMKTPDNHYLEIIELGMTILDGRILILPSSKLHNAAYTKSTSIKIKEAYTYIKAS